MMERLFKDQSGAALGLAIVMILLISVMGAGLLTFVMTDLQSVTEANRGQRALDMAEAGVQAARTKLLAEAYPSSYDADNTSNPDYIREACNNEGGWNPLPIPRGNEEDADGGGFWNPDFGVTRSFNGGAMEIEVRYLSPVSSDFRCKSPLSANNDAAYREDPNGRLSVGRTNPRPRIDAGYYRVTSTACYPGRIDTNATCQNANAAKRRVEAILNTEELDVPMAIYTKSTDAESIVLENTACVRDINVFTKGGVRLNGAGACPDDSNTSGSSNPNHLIDSGDNILASAGASANQKEDAIQNKYDGDKDGNKYESDGGRSYGYGGPFDYGNWVTSERDNIAHLRGTSRYLDADGDRFYESPFNASNPYNSVARPRVSPGIGAAGDILRYASATATTPSGTAEIRDRDYDGVTTDDGAPAPPRFVLPGGAGMTFPFDPTLVEGRSDSDRMNLLRSEALRQEEYNQSAGIVEKSENHIETSGTTVNITTNGIGPDNYKWPQYPKINESSPLRPRTSNYTTVVYVRFTGSPGVVRWQVDHGTGCSDGSDQDSLPDEYPERGILVVENGSVEIERDKTPFHGMVIVRGGSGGGGNFTQQGPSGGTPGACTGGGVDADGKITLAGLTTNLEPNDSSDLNHNRNFYPNDIDMPGTVGFHTVESWSWRESYQ